MKRSNRQTTRVPKRAFPQHLAKVVSERWDRLVAGDYSPPPCPSENLLRELLEVAYLTASTPEEDRYLKFNLVAVPATDGSGRQEIGTRSMFVERRPLSVAELQRLAPAVDINKSGIWVVWDDKAWEIAGLVDLGTSWFRARLGLGYQYRYPQCLLVQIDRPGRVRVYQGTYHVATLTDGIIEGHYGIGLHLSLHEPANSGLAKMQEHIIHPRIEEPREYFEFEFMALWNTYAAIVNTISFGRHGGALIIGDDDTSAGSPHLRIKYKQKSTALRDAFIRWLIPLSQGDLNMVICHG